MRGIVLLAALMAVVMAWPAVGQDFAAAMNRAENARSRNDFATAEAAYLEATRIAPTAADAWHMLGLVRGYQGKYDSGLGALIQAQRLAPDDDDIALSIARLFGFAGRHAEAAARVDEIINRRPDLQAAWTLKGRIASYQNRLDEAQQAYAKAASLAPPDFDLLLAYGDLARARNDERRAREYYERAAALDPNSVEIKDRLTARRIPRSAAWVLSASGGKSWLSRTPAPDWTAADLTLEHAVGKSAHISGGISYVRRFGFDDTMLRLGARASGQRLAGSLELGITPDDNVLPEVQALVAASYRLTGGEAPFGPTVLALDGSIRDYAVGTVKTLAPGVDQYLADGHLAFSLRLANTWDASGNHLLGWTAAALWQASNRLGIRLAYGDAPEAERGFVADTRTLGAALIFAVNDGLDWRLDVSRESRDGGYRRIEALTGFSVKF